jgi:NAD(P)-dependent dehydrogenase (short-subunit alcohol dehydrogenase family)
VGARPIVVSPNREVPLIAFLYTPDAHWITAQTIRANGGMSA